MWNMFIFWQVKVSLVWHFEGLDFMRLYEYLMFYGFSILHLGSFISVDGCDNHKNCLEIF